GAVGPRADARRAPPKGGRRIGDLGGLGTGARPQVVVSCQGPPRSRAESKNPYEAGGARFLGTWPHGAVTIRSHASGMVVETFARKERFVIPPPPRSGGWGFLVCPVPRRGGPGTEPPPLFAPPFGHR